MKASSHLRPREKIAERAVHALTDNELLQAVIGSGTARYPVRVLARRVQKLLRQGIPSLETLREISGIGDALASRLVAVFELATRLSAPQGHDVSDARTRSSIEVTFFSQANNQLAFGEFDRCDADARLLQRICRQAILVNASRVMVRLRYDDIPARSILNDLCFIRELVVSLSLFDIATDSVKRLWKSNVKELL
jgi:hypothetical protein